MHIFDRRNRSWLILTASLSAVLIGIHAALSSDEPRPLGGGSTLGLWLGLVGSVLMVYVGLVFVALRQRDRRLPISSRMALPHLGAALLLSPLHLLPAWHNQTRAWWLRAHVWMGLFSMVVILCHSGYRWGGWLTVTLWVLLLLLLASGVFGLLMQQFLPQGLSIRFPHEAPYGQIPHFRQVTSARATELLNALAVETSADDPADALRQFGQQIGSYLGGGEVCSKRFFSGQVSIESYFENFRLRMGWPRFDVADRDARLERISTEVKTAGKKWEQTNVDALLNADPPLDLRAKSEQFIKALDPFAPQAREVSLLFRDCWLAQIEQLCFENLAWDRQERMYHWLHGWLLIHIPLSLALLILALTHAIVALYF